MYDEQEGVTITTTRGVKAVKSFDDMGLRWGVSAAANGQGRLPRAAGAVARRAAALAGPGAGAQTTLAAPCKPPALSSLFLPGRTCSAASTTTASRSPPPSSSARCCPSARAATLSRRWAGQRGAPWALRAGRRAAPGGLHAPSSAARRPPEALPSTAAPRPAAGPHPNPHCATPRPCSRPQAQSGTGKSSLIAMVICQRVDIKLRE
jgi:hypothetical protein